MDQKKKVQQKLTVWKLLKCYVLGKKLFLLIVCLFVTSIITFVKPLVIKGITDEGMLKADLKAITFFSLLLLFASLLEQLGNAVQTARFAEIQNAMTLSLYQQAFEKIMRLKKSYFTNHNSAEIINRVSTDIHSVSVLADRRMLFMISYILSIIGGTFGLLVLNWKLAIVVISVVPIKAVLAVKIANQNEKLIFDINARMQRFHSWFGDILNGIKEIKLWNLQEQKKKTLLEKQKELLRASKKSILCNSYSGILDSLINGVVICILYIYGGYLFLQGELSLGGVTAYISYSSQVLGPVASLMSVRYMFSTIRPSLKRLNDFFSLEEVGGQVYLDSEIERVDDVHSLRMDNLVFSHTEEDLLTGISFHAYSGQKIAIIGANGSGKSTLIDLLLRFEEFKEGRMFVNETDAAIFSDAQYWDMFAVVDQEPYFFKDSVRNNVDPKREHSDEEIIRAFEQCGILEFFYDRFKGDLNHIVHYDAGDLSGGERKRLAIVRAILKDAPILVMDEAAADYDFESERKLSEMIATQFRDKIIIYITHNYSYLDIFDEVLNLVDGKLKRLTRVQILDLKQRSISRKDPID